MASEPYSAFHRAQSEVLLEGIEVAITMQQIKTLLGAESCNEAAYGGADSNTLFAQPTVVAGG